MSFTTVKRSDGSSVIVSNLAKDSGGGSHTVADDALNSAGNPVAIFTASVNVNPVKIIQFQLNDRRVFEL